MNLPDDVVRALRPLATILAPLLAPLVAKELRAQTDDANDPWIDQEHSPLGRRNHCRACKTGRVEGAYKVGKRWLARRSALDEYVRVNGRQAPEPPEPDENEDEVLERYVRSLEAECGIAEVKRKK